MYDHLGLRVKDMKKAVAFYTAALAPLGHKPGPSGEGYAGFGPDKDTIPLWLHPTTNAGATGVHICFRAKSRAEVDAFHAAALKAGAKDNGAPGIRTDYSPTYYAAFVIDADNNNLEAVFMG
ncbi:MAG: VOC family protein [Phreatobacter sp.]|uniref:VOC family protein n=1 Tax=Phreatobacter sp. TaxID=1966341 RepID=UPI001A4AD2FA|nr:VOC family protein [Phreatobacter sp.]MBL8570386.1 VOC family protein [Phreatobacter sp.]